MWVRVVMGYTNTCMYVILHIRVFTEEGGGGVGRGGRGGGGIWGGGGSGEGVRVVVDPECGAGVGPRYLFLTDHVSDMSIYVAII